MKGVILAGGTGTRMMPCTKVTNKHLLPVYNKPMIYFPLQTLIDAGIKEILIVSGKKYAGHFIELLGSGREIGVKLNYLIQDEAGGIAQALALAEDFAGKENIMVILGDNIVEDNFKSVVNDFEEGAMVFLKKVVDPQRFGVAELEGDLIKNIEEKPQIPKSNLAQTGIFIYDKEVFEFIRNIKPSLRGELEITDVNNKYIKSEKMKFSVLNGFWSDAGTFESLTRASNFVRKRVVKDN